MRSLRNRRWRVFGWVLATALLGATGGPGRESAEPTPPNILLVIIDTIRQDALSCYGNTRQTSPNMDRLASEGMLYLHAVSPSPWTAPGIASIFTGYLPSEHGLTIESLSLDQSRETVAEVLKEAGYQTAAFSNNPWFSSGCGLDQGFGEFTGALKEFSSGQHSFPDSGAKRTNDLVGEWLQGKWDGKRPFFIVVHYMEPHLNYNPPPPFDQKFVGKDTSPELIDKLRVLDYNTSLGYVVGEAEVPAEHFAILRALYDGEIAYVDEMIQNLVGILKNRGVYDEAFFILTGDHGENIGEHKLMDHVLSIHDTLLRVPLILRHPPTLPVGKRIHRAVQTQDIFATILQAAGLEGEIRGRGRSLLDEGSAGRPVFAQYYRPHLIKQIVEKLYPKASFKPFDRRLASVEKDGLKLIWASDGRHELYDIKVDPGETRNLIEERPEEAKALLKEVVK